VDLDGVSDPVRSPQAWPRTPPAFPAGSVDRLAGDGRSEEERADPRALALSG